MVTTTPGSLEFELAVIRFREDNWTIIYCPALNLNGYGKNVSEAEKAFASTLRIYLKDTVEERTLELDLEKLGWTKNELGVKPPSITRLISFNPDFRKILNTRVYVKNHKKIALPLSDKWPRTSKTYA